MQTPSVLHVSDVASWGVISKLPALSGTCSWCDWSGSSYSHLAFTVFHMGHIIYQKHFSGTSVLPVAHNNAAHVCSDYCIQCTTIVLFWSTAVMHRNMSLTKPNPAMVWQCPDMAHIMSVRKLLLLVSETVVGSLPPCHPDLGSCPIALTYSCDWCSPCIASLGCCQISIHVLDMVLHTMECTQHDLNSHFICSQSA